MLPRLCSDVGELEWQVKVELESIGGSTEESTYGMGICISILDQEYARA
ncbi:MAG TPA: hypothetical protein VNK96_10335 [Fimbriimonadales bacterium]|nr:hypothetical protein [Fimbriimonadales bacterium]